MWGFRYAEMGGYDSMTDAIYIREGAGFASSPIVIDLASFGQRSCGEVTPDMAQKAMDLAQRVVDGLNNQRVARQPYASAELAI